ncbi:nitrogenase cofactor biosynthesis protein NifB [Phaeovulum vinaykumarii]|uniref:FeMo cofactor biosynthesis protein NifB n=1 Tax=Phaeovulum vinaykumarii TaxID=407234 RepID=A0A1N7JX12_9RHOB|nr:nitrogenase cofactor biosynthesis protein NifB [Phaeovulum vinaykumarii]SIS53892.1 nitrogen fixation protein NifB [Phaeovulum vinaykumarii]SOB91746.1 nitrogen fixation protein NifB [Phaeovulum vinaykumarii]
MGELPPSADNIVALDTARSAPQEALDKAMSKSGCGASSCGSSAGPEGMDPETWAKVKDHPCYSEEAHHYFARMHVAVAPACNIQCNYCNRKYDCSNESRPGVVSERLSPEDAARKVLAVAREVPQLSVLGIAGPGDAAFDWKKTRATFDLVSKSLPDIKLCLSSNGLSIPDHLDELVDMRVDHVTLTINALDPEIAAKIYPWVYFKGRRHTGIAGARILLERQMEALEGLVARGILVKVNSVMIPGINDAHLREVNKVVKAKGAFLHNIMPLISDPAHGTHFGLTGQRGPTTAELNALQDACSDGANLMRHCRQCRADAVGLLGEDRGQEFTLDKLPEVIEDDPETRQLYREWVASEREDRRAAARAAEESLAPQEAPVLIAVATKGGGRVNAHFGHVTEFQVYAAEAGAVRFVGHRRVDNYCLGGHGDSDRLDEIIRVLDGVPVVLCSRIGDAPREKLAAAGIDVVDAYAQDYIETAVAAAARDRAQAQASRRA